MKIGIGLKTQAYTPEAYAYTKYLRDRNLSVQLESEGMLDLDNDINIYFMGIRPFWTKNKGKALEIHEYQSLSVAPYPYVKDFVKKSINRKPAGRIFLNKIVRKGMGFSDQIPYIHRDMGVDESLFQQPDSDPEYDVVYAGSIDGRPGLIEQIIKLAKKDLNILIIGDARNEVSSLFYKYNNVTFTGRVNRDELAVLYRKCRAGLNYTPDIYPFNIQTSTKVLEYLSSGLILITNSYEWLNNFCSTHNISTIRLERTEVDKNTLNSFENKKVDLSMYSWSKILDNGFYSFLQKTYEG